MKTKQMRTALVGITEGFAIAMLLFAASYSFAGTPNCNGQAPGPSANCGTADTTTCFNEAAGTCAQHQHWYQQDQGVTTTVPANPGAYAGADPTGAVVNCVCNYQCVENGTHVGCNPGQIVQVQSTQNPNQMVNQCSTMPSITAQAPCNQG